MTTCRLKRCDHCNTPYSYQASGVGCDSDYNDARYCPSCAEVVAKALSKVPVAFKKRWVDTTDYTKEQVIEAQEKRLETPGESPVRRIMPGLFNMEKGVIIEAQNGVCERLTDPISLQKVYYSVSWWESGRYPTEIKKEVWWDISNGKVAGNQRDDNS